MKFAVDLDKGILGTADSTEMWSGIIKEISNSVLKRPNVRILVVACGHGTEAVILAKRMMALGISKEQANKSIWLIDKYRVFTNHAKLAYGFKNVVTEDFLNWETNMKFDAIVGNPPFDGEGGGGGQNKIYDPICKKALTLLKDDGVIAFITPASALKESKRFSVINQPGLKVVDFTADNHFTVGIKICAWVIDKRHKGDVTVKYDGGTESQPSNRAIYDYSIVDKDFAKLYTALKLETNTPAKRMFKQNNFGPAMVKKQDKTHPYPLHKIDNGTKLLTFYSSREPYYIGKKKFTISMTKGFSDNAVVVDTADYDVAHLTIAVKNAQEVENIKSFIFSDYFVNHSARWKEVDGYGYNFALKYLPPFDVTKKWTNKSVQKFLESFVK